MTVIADEQLGELGKLKLKKHLKRATKLTKRVINPLSSKSVRKVAKASLTPWKKSSRTALQQIAKRDIKDFGKGLKKYGGYVAGAAALYFTANPQLAMAVSSAWNGATKAHALKTAAKKGTNAAGQIEYQDADGKPISKADYDRIVIEQQQAQRAYEASMAPLRAQLAKLPAGPAKDAIVQELQAEAVISGTSDTVMPLTQAEQAEVVKAAQGLDTKTLMIGGGIAAVVGLLLLRRK